MVTSAKCCALKLLPHEAKISVGNAINQAFFVRFFKTQSEKKLRIFKNSRRFSAKTRSTGGFYYYETRPFSPKTQKNFKTHQNFQNSAKLSRKLDKIRLKTQRTGGVGHVRPLKKRPKKKPVINTSKIHVCVTNKRRYLCF